MGFEQSKFGDGSNAGSGNVVSVVHNLFGRRQSKGTVGVYETDGLIWELAMDLDGEMVSKGQFPLLPPKLPKGSKIRNILMVVTEAFALGGTTPSIKIGTLGSEATNGTSITQAQAQALGTYDLTTVLAGTWANPITANTTIGLALAGTAPTSNVNVGKARLVIRYDNILSK